MNPYRLRKTCHHTAWIHRLSLGSQCQYDQALRRIRWYKLMSLSYVQRTYSIYYMVHTVDEKTQQRSFYASLYVHATKTRDQNEEHKMWLRNLWKLSFVSFVISCRMKKDGRQKKTLFHIFRRRRFYFNVYRLSRSIRIIFHIKAIAIIMQSCSLTKTRTQGGNYCFSSIYLETSLHSSKI